MTSPQKDSLLLLEFTMFCKTQRSCARLQILKTWLTIRLFMTVLQIQRVWKFRQSTKRANHHYYWETSWTQYLGPDWILKIWFITRPFMIVSYFSVTEPLYTTNNINKKIYYISNSCCLLFPFVLENYFKCNHWALTCSSLQWLHQATFSPVIKIRGQRDGCEEHWYSQPKQNFV